MAAIEEKNITLANEKDVCICWKYVSPTVEGCFVNERNRERIKNSSINLSNVTENAGPSQKLYTQEEGI
ncbi:hypothetical protein QU481_17570 [Crenobacter sp. SG2303]|uniref:Uncharacterized protein n=1 Tax=Crenobacter oryzisoli TaxID=3056844 RepID=A0ABT7XSG5_9NEIS|nr:MULTISPECIES: hypothetical protein [unclassified Crenobacter]MDN0076670.1 hypothetical protein [Crenobacter sp. SG2303]MDN0083937.1 hypothetical protein [Crenobacter sp. SG2305]